MMPPRKQTTTPSASGSIGPTPNRIGSSASEPKNAPISDDNDSERGAAADRAQAGAEHQPQNARARRAERHVHPNFVRPRGDRVRDDAVDACRGDEQREHAEEDGDRRRESRRLRLGDDSVFYAMPSRRPHRSLASGRAVRRSSGWRDGDRTTNDAPVRSSSRIGR